MARRNPAAAWWLAGVACLSVAGVVGCGGGDKKDDGKSGAGAAAAVPTIGPNGGRFAPLGNQEGLVEIVHVRDGSIPNVSFYLFDKTGKRKLMTGALEMAVKTKVGAAAVEHKIFSAPQPDEYGGQSSRFRTTEKPVVDALVALGTVLEMTVTVGDKKLTGTITNEGEPPAPTATGTGTGARPSPTGRSTGTAAGTAKPTPTTERAGTAGATGTKPTGTATGSATATGTAEKK
jgi:hypothetical protein